MLSPPVRQQSIQVVLSAEPLDIHHGCRASGMHELQLLADSGHPCLDTGPPSGIPSPEQAHPPGRIRGRPAPSVHRRCPVPDGSWQLLPAVPHDRCLFDVSVSVNKVRLVEQREGHTGPPASLGDQQRPPGCPGTAEAFGTHRRTLYAIEPRHCIWTAKNAKHAENPLIFLGPGSRHLGGSRRFWTVIRLGSAEACWPFAVSATFAVKYLG